MIKIDNFGALPNTLSPSNTALMQQAINSAISAGENIYVPAGLWRIESGLVIDHSSNTSDKGPRTSMIGEGMGVSIIQAENTSFNAITFLGGTVGGWNSYQVLKDLDITRASYAIPLYGRGLVLDKLAYFNAERVRIDGFGVAMFATDVLSSNFYACHFRKGVKGVLMSGNGASNPNAITFSECHFGLNTGNPIELYKPGCVNIRGGAIEGNNGRVYIENSGGQSGTGVNIDGVYFENNLGAADVHLVNSLEPTVCNITNCYFGRVDASRFTTNNILLETNTFLQILNVNGNSFMGYNNYVPSSSRKYIHVVYPAQPNRVNFSENYCASAIETPSFSSPPVAGSGTIVLGRFHTIGAAAVLYAGSTGISSVAKISVGYVRVNFSTPVAGGSISFTSCAGVTGSTSANLVTEGGTYWDFKTYNNGVLTDMIVNLEIKS